MKTKRMLSLLLVFVMSLGLLAGCGKKTNVEALPDVILGFEFSHYIVNCRAMSGNIIKI